MRSLPRVPVLALLLLIFSGFPLSGCTPHRAGESLPESREQAYIDLKLGFSLVVPISWQRQKFPVSSQAYRSNRVTWEMADQGTMQGRLSVELVPTGHVLPLEDLLCEFLGTRDELLESRIVPASPPEGLSLRLEGRNAHRDVIYLLSRKGEKTYIIAIEATLKPGENREYLESIINSFKIL